LTELEAPRIGLVELKALAAKDEAEELEDAKKASEAMQFLERRLRNKVIEVPLAVGDEKHVFRIRPMSVAELNRFNEIREELQQYVRKPVPRKTIEPLNEEIAKLLADLCYDKSLDFDYWMGHRGQYDPYDMGLFLAASARLELPEEEKIRFFPKAVTGKASSSY
jgi:hypothetical protein